ncbi:MAG: redoxin family protein [Planctomycetota bacterium]
MVRTITAALSLALAATTLATEYTADEIVFEGMTVDQLRAELPQFEQPDLWFGGNAPELTIAEWVKGDQITGFEPGTVYVVEFWATWCGPCIRAFPHLTELNKDYGDKVEVIGVNIWERSEGEARAKAVRDFVASQGERMGYTVALEEGTSMSESWMRPANRNGIPSAFIVDQQGDIAWMGHPMAMDEPLEQIVAGEYNSAEAAKTSADEQMLQGRLQYVLEKIDKGDADRGYALLKTMIDRELGSNPGMLNQLAWVTLKNPQIPARDPDFSLRAAQKAAELTEHKNADVLDTLAHALAATGNKGKAIEMINKAIELAESDEQRENYISSRNEFQNAG